MLSLTDNIHAAQTVRGIPPEHYPLPFESFAEMLAERQKRDAEGLWMVWYDENSNRQEYTFGAFIERVRKTASFLASLGIGRGSRIATAAHNHPDTIVQYFAAWMMGACVVPLNMSEDDDRLRYILSNAGATLLLCREDYLHRTTSLVPSSVTVVPVYNDPAYNDEATANGFHARIAAQPAMPFPSDVQREDEAFIVYTSGTTGNPKGVVLTQRALLADSAAIARWHSITPATRMMCVLPVHHVNGTIVTHTTPMLAGASVVLNRKFQTDSFFERVEREGVHIVSVVPTLLAFLLEAAKSSAYIPHYSSLRHIICGAGPLTCELARQFEERFGITILHGYGLSETTCYSCYLPTDLSASEHLRWMQDFGFPSIGVPIEANEMAIHDEAGRELGEMERGEIVVRGANVMKEYYQNPAANESTFVHGWFRSGDEGFFKRDAGGRAFFFITGRLKELIIRGGVNLAPLEIDEVLAQAPGVKAGICVGFENDFYGEEVGALVIPASPDVATAASADEILRHCQAHLPFSKAPKVVVFTDELPVTSTGKYQRNKVKHLFAAWKGMQFRKMEP
jgi:long-chain acyl-CoA synthetase